LEHVRDQGLEGKEIALKLLDKWWLILLQVASIW
jgi:hypothetical protein